MAPKLVAWALFVEGGCACAVGFISSANGGGAGSARCVARACGAAGIALAFVLYVWRLRPLRAPADADPWEHGFQLAGAVLQLLQACVMVALVAVADSGGSDDDATAATLRLELLQEYGTLVQDMVICGADKSQVGLMIFPSAEALALAGDGAEQDGALMSDALCAALAEKLALRADHGSAARVNRVMVLAEPPSLGDGEITAKGNLNYRKVLARRASLLDRLYSDDDPAVIRL